MELDAPLFGLGKIGCVAFLLFQGRTQSTTQPALLHNFSVQGLPPRKVLGLCWRNRKHLGIIGGRYHPPDWNTTTRRPLRSRARSGRLPQLL
jgi:hypothetical protein